MDDPVTVEEVHAREDLPHDVFDSLRGQAGRGALLYVEIEILVDMLEHEVEHHLPVHPLAVADIEQPDVRLFYYGGQVRVGEGR